MFMLPLLFVTVPRRGNEGCERSGTSPNLSHFRQKTTAALVQVSWELGAMSHLPLFDDDRLKVARSSLPSML